MILSCYSQHLLISFLILGFLLFAWLCCSLIPGFLLHDHHVPHVNLFFLPTDRMVCTSSLSLHLHNSLRTIYFTQWYFLYSCSTNCNLTDLILGWIHRVKRFLTGSSNVNSQRNITTEAVSGLARALKRLRFLHQQYQTTSSLVTILDNHPKPGAWL